ncbi:aminodeoxychorismate/anthranilate synthase component II [Listeria marthii]|uniref:anthranilate synthase component II n=1 Tax=Listeria marthii TaxID=529731 RepID=UPI0016280280|nr:aminodeoxychorismate/anthranilate synthase component II [Listeria marthii]MBC1970823.1 aminodeoxychorismate/anthranilate synthase component II [Listeria marthii]MBC2063147.1 aminodeoxychorismate/anthranilate synthase component II [Listeria marthii]MBC2077481.1 aminodeoxychorismate/anthranilate synthase component II [Listeria marthii]MBC2086382.1 aminodeoxychorismate/anthranilate synthase component II [Listeria marthii]MBF2490577.1 aminodeoxychorismate/anthranilate synthase component II [Lis
MILIIDHNDSFTYNLMQYTLELTSSVKVINYDKLSVEDVKVDDIRKIILSPGPKAPKDYEKTKNIIECFKGKVPILGVCLGHQIIAEFFGGETKHAPYVCHGKAAQIEHDSRGIFDDIQPKINVARYHSLVISEKKFPKKELKITSRTMDGLIMGVRHHTYDIEGVQFHPESILTEQGFKMMQNFVLNERQQ